VFERGPIIQRCRDSTIRVSEYLLFVETRDDDGNKHI